jgi:cold shock CspA family protein
MSREHARGPIESRTCWRDEEMMELSMLLPSWQIVEMEGVAHSRGLTARQLEDYVRRQRGDVKAHELAPLARVSQLFPQEGYDFLATPDGREIYFHRHIVLHDGFDRLAIGTEVTFVEEEEGKKGPQASTVRPVGRRRHL